MQEFGKSKLYYPNQDKVVLDKEVGSIAVGAISSMPASVDMTPVVSHWDTSGVCRHCAAALRMRCVRSASQRTHSWHEHNLL